MRLLGQYSQAIGDPVAAEQHMRNAPALFTELGHALAAAHARVQLAGILRERAANASTIAEVDSLRAAAQALFIASGLDRRVVHQRG
jgi:hypothetical protein